jgi:hypothetical protein
MNVRKEVMQIFDLYCKHPTNNANKIPAGLMSKESFKLFLTIEQKASIEY